MNFKKHFLCSESGQTKMNKNVLNKTFTSVATKAVVIWKQVSTVLSRTHTHLKFRFVEISQKSVNYLLNSILEHMKRQLNL